MGKKNILKRLYLNYIMLPERYVTKWKVHIAKHDITTMYLITKLVQEFLDGIDD